MDIGCFELRIAVGTTNISPKKSKVLRRNYRLKSKDLLSPGNSKPDFVECMTNLSICLAVDSSEEKKRLSLEERVLNAFLFPDTINRFGCVSIGESRNLVNEIKVQQTEPDGYYWLNVAEGGKYQFTTWVNFANKSNVDRFDFGVFNPSNMAVIRPANS